MIGMDVDHHRVVNERLQQGRAMDASAMASLAALQERLAHMQRTHSALAQVSFSSYVTQACEQVPVAAVS